MAVVVIGTVDAPMPATGDEALTDIGAGTDDSALEGTTVVTETAGTTTVDSATTVDVTTAAVVESGTLAM